MRLTNLIRRDVFVTSGELAIPGGVFMAGGGPGGVVGGVRVSQPAYGLLTRPNFGRVMMVADHPSKIKFWCSAQKVFDNRYKKCLSES